MDWIIWLGLAVALGIAEMLSLTFVLLMLAGGAGAAALAAALGVPLWGQMGVAVVVAVVLLAVIRPYAKQMRETRLGPDADIGLKALEGARARVLEQVDQDQGLVKVEGQEWTARSFDGEQVLNAGDEVTIVEIRGATAMVWSRT